jgi:hypothetical protein
MCIIAYRTAELCKTAFREVLKKGKDFKVDDRTIEFERNDVAYAVSVAKRVWRD